VFGIQGFGDQGKGSSQTSLAASAFMARKKRRST
jgi:hypothetical protein